MRREAFILADMLRFFDRHRTSDGGWTRRDWLTAGSLAGLAGALGAVMPGPIGDRFGARRATAAEPTGSSGDLSGFGRAKSVIMVFASGGQSQFETWDPKPDAPADVRGEFGSIATRVPGVRFCEHLPRTTEIADRLAVVRCMSHEDLDHGSAVYLALTGHYHTRRSSNPAPSSIDSPTFGAVLRRLRPNPKFICDAIHLNGPALVPTNPSPGQNGGLLGRASEPMLIGDVRDATGAIPGLAPQPGLPPVRLGERLSLKETLDAYAQSLDKHPQAADFDRLYHDALKLLGSPRARAAFDLDAEPPAVRDRYGRHRSGQACLLARRLVEAGVPYVNVIWNHSNRGQDLAPDDTDLYGWDTHNDIFASLRERLLPRFDESFSALISDLDSRGLLETTLVICMGEFGRAPRVALEPKFAGATPGRKHWPNVYSIALAGAGVGRGIVVGASDRLGAEPAGDRFGPWDVGATIFHALGIDPSGFYSDATGRMLPITHGRPLLAAYRGQ